MSTTPMPPNYVWEPPPGSRIAIAAARKKINETLGVEKSRAEVELKLAEDLAAGLSEQNIVFHCSSLPVGHPCRSRRIPSPSDDRMRNVVDKHAYDRYVEDHRMKIPTLRENLAKAKAAYDAAIAAIPQA